MLIQGIKFSVASAIYAVRSRLPLYADDRSKIYSRYAQSLLNFSIVPSVPTAYRFKLWDRFADTFTMPVSVERFYRTVGSAPDVRKDLEDWVSSEKRTDFLNNLQRKQRAYSAYRMMSVDELLNLQREAVLVASGERLDVASKTTIAIVKSLKILHDFPQQIQRVNASLNDPDEIDQDRQFKCLSETYTGMYSEGQLEASIKADKVGEAIAQTLCDDVYFGNVFQQETKPEIALLISDLVYRAVQNFTGLRSAFNDLDAGTPLILTARNLDFAPKASELGLSVISRNKIYDPFLATLEKAKSTLDLDAQNIAKPKFYKTEWDEQISAIDQRIAKSLAKIDTTGRKPKVFILCDRRPHSYDTAISRIEKTLHDKYKFIPINAGAPSGLANNVLAAARQDLFSVLRSWSIRQMVNLKPTVRELILQAFKNIEGLDDFERDGLCSRVQNIVETNFGSIVAHGRLYDAFSAMLTGQSETTQALLMPGRNPTVRVMTRAFLAAGLQTTDVQVLYVTKMPRYKTPIADRIAVFDSYARTHFCERYGYKTENTRLIGSMNVDADVAEAKSCNADAVYKEIFGGPKAPVFTYGMQPISVEDFERAIKWCAKTLDALPETRLIIKLHPAQSDDVVEACENIIRNNTGPGAQERWRVLLKTPFHEVVAISDVLLTHYSNIAMTAGAMGKGVGTLPVSGTRPEPTWADMKMATDIENAEHLTEFVRSNLDPSKVSETEYFKLDPQMKSGKSLQSLDDIISENITQSTSSKETGNLQFT